VTEIDAQDHVQAVFEGGMYTFVFLWTPTLSPQGEDIPYGFVFSMYMVSSMAGSAIAGHLFNLGYKPEKFMRWVFFVASLCMAVPIAFHAHKETDASGKAHLHQQITGAGMLQCLAFCIFEICIGIFWPSMMRLRAHYLPDEQRATLINFFRVPLNLFVCIVLYNVAAFPLSVMFGLCSVFMLINCACCNVFASILGREERTNKGIAGLL
jgi:MFS family permease